MSLKANQKFWSLRGDKVQTKDKKRTPVYLERNTHWMVQSWEWICLGGSWAFIWFLQPPWHGVQRSSQFIPTSLWGALPLILPILCYTVLAGLLPLLTSLLSPVSPRMSFHPWPFSSNSPSSGPSSDTENPSSPFLHKASSTLFYCYLIPCCPHMVNFRSLKGKKLVFPIIYLLLP